MLNSFCLIGMRDDFVDMKTNNINAYVTQISNKIDNHHLGISKNICFKPIIGAACSYYQSTFLPIKKINEEMQTIQSYIITADNTDFIRSDENKKLICEKLAAKHYYVHYLIKALIKKKIQQFEDNRFNN